MDSVKEKWRFINSGASDGAFNMACDEAAARKFDLKVPLLRVFSWHPFTISLGFHQKITDLDQNKSKRDGISIVRRPTGGRAIFHAEEITYSIIIPKTHTLFSKGTLAAYNQISRALVTGLNKLGLNLKLKKTQKPDDAFASYTNELACFSTSALYEVHSDSKKIIGSAQRRFKNTLLQHGSIITGEKHLEIFKYFQKINNSETVLKQLETRTTSISKISNVVLSEAQIISALKTGFEEHFDVNFSESHFSHQELEIINQLKPKYLN